MTAIILAGGRSTRMGYDKAFIKLDGLSLVNRQLKILRKIFKKIIIVTNNPDRYKFNGIQIVSDIISHRGPLSGIYSGLVSSDSFYNFVVACDMPFINTRLIKYMDRLKKGFDIVAPRVKNGYETLFAIYSKNCILPIYDILHSDNFRITGLFDKLKLKIIGEQEMIKFGDPKILFMNINTQEDQRSAKEMKGANTCQK